MKRTGLGHPKIKRLAELLGISEAHAVGTLEMLWHFVGRHAICGNIGKWSNAEIAVGAGWPADDAERLVAALIEARLIDRHSNHRLVVHDWHDHAEDLVKKTIRAKGWTFANLDAEAAPISEDAGTVPEVSGKVQTFRDSLSLSPEPKPKPKPSSPTLRSDETDLELAKWMWKLITQLQPTRKKPNLEKWANVFRLMRERDERSEQDIRALFAWANADSFWQSNILSPQKLREHWETLKLKMERPNGKQQRNLVGAGQRYDPDAASKNPGHGDM